MRRAISILICTLACAGVGLGVAAMPASANATATLPQSANVGAHTYLVVLKQAPAASYQGDITGYPATSPKPGQRFDADSAGVSAYRAYLLEQQALVLGKVGGPAPLYSYTTALDGFAAKLTAPQARTLQSEPGVLLVQPDQVVQVDETTAGVRAGATAEPPTEDLWRQVGGPARAGRGVVVGVIDTGAMPENPSLAGIPMATTELERRYPGFTGSCQAGAHWAATTCTSKIIAARYFVRGFGRADVATADYLSPRDGSGHGTSVAAIAAGNSGIDTQIAGQRFGHISGVAPAAALSIYKVCWSAPDPARDGCDLADVVAGIDQAVRDGVDVLNYSVAGTGRGLDDAVELAFLNAAAAHVFVAAAAGNNGPRAGSVGHPSPWVTTVGANTQNVFQGGIKLGNGRTLVGAMLSDRNVGPAPLVYAGDAPSAGVSPRRAALCYPGSLNARRIDGAIVVCERGVTARVSKSAAVAQSGGSAMVLVNTAPGSLDADMHAVPTVHLDEADGSVVKRYIDHAKGTATGSILANATNHPLSPVVAGFSGRGPTDVADGDLLKPDVTAPGVSVVSAVEPGTDEGRLWDVESGTSIAAPHVAGLAAVVRAAHPTWSPAAVKSAMMTTATPLEGSSSPLSRGAGEVNPGSVLDPGLVYDASVTDWAHLLSSVGIGSATTPTTSGFDASNLNQPSISIGDLVAPETVTRTVTNVGRTRETYTATVQDLRGVAGAVTPASLTLSPGQSRSFTLTLSATRGAVYDAVATGSLTWRDTLGRNVTIPLAIRPELAAVPAEVAATGRQGSVAINALAGVTGTIRTGASGLVGATPVPLSLRVADFDPQHPATSEGTAVATLTVPPGARAARFQTLAAQAGDDVDMYVYRGDQLVASATGAAGNETVTLPSPEVGRYRVFVNAHAALTGHTAHVTLTSWVLPHSSTGNLTVTPHAFGVNGGERFSVTAAWAKLSTKQRWWGLISYAGLPSVTYVTIN